MNCRELCEFIGEYLDGEMPEEVRATFEQHIARCPPCECYLRQYRATIAAGRCACTGDQDVSGAVPEELIRAILASRARKDERKDQ